MRGQEDGPRTTWSLLDPDIGGRGDGRAPEDDAIRRVLERAEPGDTLLFPPGRTYLVDHVELTLPLTLRAAGATLRKSARTADHMFVERAGRADGTRVEGGTFDMRRDAFEPGQTVSPFHFVRAHDLTFAGITVRDGIEEGLKLYGCQRVRVENSRFEGIRNNGVQFHTPAVDGFVGTRPPQSSRDLVVHACVFADVDDGAEGLADGHGVTFNSTHPEHTTEHGVVHRCVVERCIRGLWAEFGGAPGRLPGRSIHFVGNRVEGCRFFGLGMVGVEGGAVVGNEVLDTGVRRPDPPRTSDEVVGIVLSGDSFAEGGGIVCAENRIEDRRAPGERRMQYGIRVRRGEGHVVRGNVVRGATVAGREGVPRGGAA